MNRQVGAFDACDCLSPLSYTEFLNDIVKQLWPNINAAGSKMIKEIVEPMFKTMLPGPLATLHFTKIDLGPVPLRLSNAKTTKSEVDGIKLDLNVDWVGKADIEMDASMMPALVSGDHLSSTWMPLIRDVGRRKHPTSWQALYPAVPFDKRHTTGTQISEYSPFGALPTDTRCRSEPPRYHSSTRQS